MKYDWEEMLDRLEEKDLIEFLPETLPEMDEVTRKRIENVHYRKSEKNAIVSAGNRLWQS